MTQELAMVPGFKGTVRNHLLTAVAQAWVMGLLLVSLAAGGCRSSDRPDRSQRDLANLDQLLRLMGQRLELMHDVARWKWNAGQSITDPQRERELLQSAVERGRDKGLDPELVHSFFAAQMEAARLVQQADFDRWKANQQEKFVDTTSLTAVRQKIDDLNRQLIDALTEIQPQLSSQTVQQALPLRAETILIGDGPAEARKIAIRPLRR